MKIYAYFAQFFFTSLAIFLVSDNCFCQTPQPNREIYKPQDLAPKSPDAANLFRFNDVPVDLSSGTANINIPIYTINVGRLQVPISISYNTSGIKLLDIASPIGLGWSLSPAYMVTIDGETDVDNFSTRTVTTLPQALDATVNYNTMANNMQLLDVANGYLDQEQTKFHFRCGDISGTFLYDQNKVLQIISKTKNLKIELKRLNDQPTTAVIGCKITTNEGIEYTFNKAESFVNVRKFSWSINSGLCVTQIKDLITGESISFVYKDKLVYTDFRSETNTFSEVEDMGSPGSCPYSPHCWDYSSLTGLKRENNPFEVQGAFIESISFRNGYVYFESLNDRLDIDKMRLASITVYDTSVPYPGRQVKKVIFNNQSYFISDYFDASIDPKYKYRLKLQDITFNSDYTESLPIEKYSFEYNEGVKLPAYRVKNSSSNNGESNSSAVDFWGYYNGKNSNMSLIPLGLPHLNNPGIATLSNSARAADENFTQAYILTKVTYPTGGFTTFQYDNHKLSFDCASSSLPCSSPGYYLGDVLGGLRIRKIKNYSGPLSTTPDTEKNYNYISGVVLTPASSNMFSYNKIKTYIGYGPDMPNGSSIVWPYRFYQQSGNSLYGITLHNESPIYYNRVEELLVSNDGNLGKTCYTYMPADAILYYGNQIPEYGFYRKNCLSYNFGDLQSIEIYKNATSTYSLVKKETFEYDNEYSGVRPGLHIFKNGISHEVTGFVKSYDGVGDSWENMYKSALNGNSLRVSDFFLFYEPFFEYSFKRLKKNETVEYDDAGNQLVSTNNYFYENHAHYNVTRSEFINSKGDTRKMVYRYFLDKNQVTDISSSETEALNELPFFNKVDDLLEETEYLNNSIVKRKRIRYGLFTNYNMNTFESFPNVPFPSIIEVTTNQSNVQATRKEFLLAYDEWANILNRKKEYDLDITYLWGYSSIYPITEIKNASFNQVLIALGYTRSEYETQALSSTPSADYLSRVVNLRQNLPNAMITTYVYKPFVGVASVTDLNKITTYYDYDAFGRLMDVKDDKGNIVKAYNYHYKK